MMQIILVTSCQRNMWQQGRLEGACTFQEGGVYSSGRGRVQFTSNDNRGQERALRILNATIDAVS